MMPRPIIMPATPSADCSPTASTGLSQASEKLRALRSGLRRLRLRLENIMASSLFSWRASRATQTRFQNPPHQIVELDAERLRCLGYERVAGHARRRIHFQQIVRAVAISHDI